MNKKQDDVFPFEENLLKKAQERFGIEETEDQIIEFQCIDCGCIDEVPDFVVGEFSIDLKTGEEVEMVCPSCNGTLRIKKEDDSKQD
jgi:hypothetical protein